MLFRFLVIGLLFFSVDLLSRHEERREIIEGVRKYLQGFDSRKNIRTSDWLENTNKIGFGYNLLGGSPICYTGACQMDEFTRSIFKLNYTSPVIGSCTNKSVPNNVELDCSSSMSLTIQSEIIDTIEHLHTSISNKVQVFAGAKFMNIGFSYSFSKETRHMIDNIIKKHQSAVVR
jgi:hypothetical protein